jgi:hypothetical protein
MDVGADIDEGLGWVTEGFAKLLKLKDAFVDIITVVGLDIMIKGLGAPNLGRNFNH